MIEIGRLCLKIAGRDAGRFCLVVDEVDKNHVLIDGQTRRKKCNKTHLEPLDKVVKLKKAASHEEVVKALKELKIEVQEKVKKEKKPKAPPKPNPA